MYYLNIINLASTVHQTNKTIIAYFILFSRLIKMFDSIRLSSKRSD